MIQQLLKGGEDMKSKSGIKKNEQGSIMLVTTIIILILTLIVVSAINISGMQYDLAKIERNTSNTYYVAEAGVEKEVETINKAIEVELPNLVKRTSQKFLVENSPIDTEQRHLIVSGDETTRKSQAVNTTNKYDQFTYESGKIRVRKCKYQEYGVDGTGLPLIELEFRDYIKYELFNFLLKYYFIDPAYNHNSDFNNSSYQKPKPMFYEVESDKYDSNYVTIVQVEPRAKRLSEVPSDTNYNRWNRDEFTVTTTSKSVYKNADGTYDMTKVYDEEVIITEVKIDIPTNLEYEFREYYDWIANPAEIVDNPITCFSDIVVEGTGNELKVIDGDVLVKGIKQTSTGADTIADADKTGGVIASNGGKIDIVSSNPSDPTKNANLYCLSNVVVTNGWGSATSNYLSNTSINVSGDVIANSINIIDDFYTGSVNQSPFNEANQGQNETITIGKNVFVDNDVMIDRWIKGSTVTTTTTTKNTAGYIQVAGTIFGISDGSKTFTTPSGDTVVDPNSSSGVFSQGIDTLITADRMLITGQPFITLSATAFPKKLFESIGEPFDGVASWAGYGEAELASAANAGYLLPTSPFINMIKDTKVATSFSNSYAMERISGIDSTVAASAERPLAETSAKGQQIHNSTVFSGPDDLRDFMFKGGATNTLAAYTSFNNYYGSSNVSDTSDITNKTVTAYISKNPVDNFYTGNTDKANYLKMYNKVFLESVPSAMTSFKGLQSYMTAMRGVFYGKFNVNVGGVVTESILDFDSIVDVSKVVDNTWSYATPIEAKSSFPTTVIANPKDPMNPLTIQYIDIKDFYVGVSGAESCYPTIIVNKGSNPLLIRADSTCTTFSGIIISKGPVILDANGAAEFKINGVVIVGGPEATSLENYEIYKDNTNCGLSVRGKVTIAKNDALGIADTKSRMLLDIESNDRVVYRSVLDALKITQYSSIDFASTQSPLAQALGQYESTNLKYKLGKVGYSRKTYLYMDTKQINVTIKSQLKK